MLALRQPHYGDATTLQLGDVEIPSVTDDTVLIRVRAASPNFADAMFLGGKPYLFRLLAFGLRRPKNPVAGLAAAGEVVAVGAGVTRFSVGDDVFGELSGAGGCAEFVVASEKGLARKPPGVSFEHAATIPIAGVTALQGLRDAGGVRAGHRVLINGASGGVGTFAVQIAKSLGAEVTAVCSEKHVDRIRALGASVVIDYGKTDFVVGGPRFDVVLDLVGNRTLAERRSVLVDDGVYVASFGQGGNRWFGPLGRILRVAIAGLMSAGRVKVLAADAKEADLVEVARLIADKEITPVIQETFPLSRAADAFALLLEGHAGGKFVIVP